MEPNRAQSLLFQRRGSLENLPSIERSDIYQYNGTGDGVPPTVGKVDGRARILRPQKQSVANVCQVTPYRPSTAISRSQLFLNDIVSKPSSSPDLLTSTLLSSSTSPVIPSTSCSSIKSQSALPSTLNLEKRNLAAQKNIVISEVAFAERGLAAIKKLRREVNKSMKLVSSMKRLDKKQLKEAMGAVGKVKNIFLELQTLAKMQLKRSPSLLPLLTKYSQLDSLYKFNQGNMMEMTRAHQQFEVLPEILTARNAMEKNVLFLIEQFRSMKVPPQRTSRFAKPPKALQCNSIYDGHSGLLKTMETLNMYAATDSLVWKYEKISHPNFSMRNATTLIEVKYASRKQSPAFVPIMKVLLVVKCGNLEDFTMGFVEEDLYDEFGIVDSRYSVYRKLTTSTKSHVLSDPNMRRFTSVTNFIRCNNYLHFHLHCLSTPCHFCKKHLFEYEPPTLVVFDSPPIICHKYCYIFSASNSQLV